MKLKIGHHKVTVVQVPALHHGGNECFGLYEAKAHRISIVNSLSPSHKIEVLLHEILHACAEAGGWAGRELDEEDAVSWASRGLTQVLIDNEAELLGFIGAALREHRKD